MDAKEFGQKFRDYMDGYLKFLADPNNPMRRVGVAFTDEQKRQIQEALEAGDVAGAQRLILDRLNEELDGD